MAEAPLIVARNVTVELGGREVLKEVNLSLGKGSYWVRGPNASGKTTLLKTLAFLIRPKKGEVLAFGKRDARGEVVYVPPNPPVLRGTVEDNLLFAVRIARKGDPYEAADALGLSSLLRKKAKELSSGQRALLGLARALAIKPKALMVDETLNYLDERNLELALEALREVEVLLVASHRPLGFPRTVEVLDGSVKMFTD